MGKEEHPLDLENHLLSTTEKEKIRLIICLMFL